MREIKFRIPMFTDKGTFTEFQYLKLGDDIEGTLCGHNGEPQQYTGLKDNQGKEIYEGDILAVDWRDQRYPPHTIGPVKWNDKDACWELGEGGSSKSDAQSHMEIIGNIYENPELLKIA